MHRKSFCCGATEKCIVYAIDRKNKRDTREPVSIKQVLLSEIP